jgi:hypothetical protein
MKNKLILILRRIFRNYDSSLENITSRIVKSCDSIYQSRYEQSAHYVPITSCVSDKSALVVGDVGREDACKVVAGILGFLYKEEEARVLKARKSEA